MTDANAANRSTDSLLATCWTSAGSASPDNADIRSPLELRQRIEFAASAGFQGFGIHAVDLMDTIRRHGVSHVQSLLDDHGIVDVEVEGIDDWWMSEPRSNHEARSILDAAGAIRTRHIKLNPDHQNRAWDSGLWAARLAEFADLAGDIDARVGLEFLPWSNIHDLRSGVNLVGAAGHPNSGLVIDVWHMERSRSSTTELSELPLNLLSGVELNDAAALPLGDLYSDTINNRRYCGDGDFDLRSFIDAIRTIGWRGPWGVEILSREHRQAEASVALARAYQSARLSLTHGAGT